MFLWFDKGDKYLLEELVAYTPLRTQEEKEMKTSPPPQDVDEIFKKMKETSLIPNVVAMLDGLCKDRLV
ncbi:Pentatricopeptide repeat-containing protein [Camellia lanceoleosa]|uniref:Pentatricopeptide repeat-containing protein n=1 Tax=Camellia lanceoleosa TaxID=1840588 RepID=A0ACC0IRS5_9ERIC|nr:Pentatricopeptide repeat-containing protein [Camellia lanceoleosa]